MKVTICDPLVAKISFQSSSKKTRPSDGGKAQTPGLSRKKRWIRVISGKKNNYAPTTLQLLVELIHRSPIISLTFKKWARIIMRQIPLTANLKETKDLMWFDVVLLFLEGRDRKRTNQIEGFVTLPSWEKW